MNASLCNCEQEVMTALRSGLLSNELQAHMTGCAQCSEVVSVARLLQRDASSLDEIPIPNPDLVWRRALRRARAEAVARAARPVQWVVHAAIAVIITMVFWLVQGSPEWFGSLPAPYTSSLYPGRGAWVVVSFVLGGVTILTALFGALYILRVERCPAALAKR
jgi:hypothetical protein